MRATHNYLFPISFHKWTRYATISVSGFCQRRTFNATMDIRYSVGLASHSFKETSRKRDKIFLFYTLVTGIWITHSIWKRNDLRGCKNNPILENEKDALIRIPIYLGVVYDEMRKKTIGKKDVLLSDSRWLALEAELLSSSRRDIQLSFKSFN